ncbi:hypothetical protein F511_41882 [Dorcoceras hygrometricum]|uniref:Uncharacterized protein n=1 Tax=Dorcoceras hygrometricum TaxID=472368 RepID=A0A2Z7AF31_9LAMI|nr:hypothetical protein F511_41882 [Dorcoceras hygrometricum]
MDIVIWTRARWAAAPSSPRTRRRRRRRSSPEIVSGQFDEENPFVLISSVLLVQPDEGVSDLVVDQIGDNLPQSTEKSRILVIPVGARHKCQQDVAFSVRMNEEVTRVSQHFGVLTIGFSSCACVERSTDGLKNQSQELLIDMMT